MADSKNFNSMYIEAVAGIDKVIKILSDESIKDDEKIAVGLRGLIATSLACEDIYIETN